jgi:DNA/RNA endonuclease YhcR with UshA esterase domain
MRLQKEEQIVLVLLLMTLCTLAVAHWALEGSSFGQATAEGRVMEIKPTATGGHLLIRLDSTDVPIFVSQGAGARDVQERISLGDMIRVQGRASSYDGMEEIKVERATDVQSLLE